MKKEYHILIVDDDLPIGTMVKKVLMENEDKFNVDYIDDPLKGLEKIKESSFDLLILDVSMPGMTGFELATEVRNISRYRKTPIVIYTSLQSKEDKLRAFSEPIYADGFITKSEDSIDFLVHQIRSIFWRKEASYMYVQLETARQLGKSIGHVVSQNLSTISGFADLLHESIKQNSFDTSKTIRFLQTIKNNSKDIERLVDYLKNLKTVEMIDIGEGDKIIKVVDDEEKD